MMAEGGMDYIRPSWMDEDEAEIEKISKPGGHALKLKDNVPIMAMKNKERSKGTFKLFSGQFDGQSFQKTVHSMDALGGGYRPPPKAEHREMQLSKSSLPDVLGRPRGLLPPTVAPMSMSRSFSAPGLQTEYMRPSWMDEDATEVEKISKPGGATLKLKDNVLLMAMKNKERSKGTFKLFSGQFDGQSFQKTVHSMDALGGGYRPPPKPEHREMQLTKSKLPDIIGRPGGLRPPAVMPLGMSRSQSMAGVQDYQRPSWMDDDAVEVEKISKPGGHTLKLKDSVTLMSMKNKERSKGTFKLFSGQFDGQSVQQATHSPESLQRSS